MPAFFVEKRECFGKFCPRLSSVQLVLGRASQRRLRRVQCGSELSCSLHQGKAVLLDGLPAAISVGLAVKLHSPPPLQRPCTTRRFWGPAGLAAAPQAPSRGKEL